MSHCWKIVISIFDLVIFMLGKCASHSSYCNNITISNVNGPAIIIIS